MKETFVEKNFSPASEELLRKILVILRDYASQGYDLSLRQLYYQLVAANVVENTERSYKNVGSLVSDARLAGLIDWNAIKDRSRAMTVNSHWENPAAILRSCVASFAIDKWADQPCYVEVMVEKQALEGVLEPVCSELDVPFTANKGYSSSSALYEAGKRMHYKVRDGKEVHVIYLGDHDPSGIDMSRDVEDRLRMFSDVDDQGGSLELHRVALNIEQVRKLRPPENPAKLTDSRADAYIAKFGRSSWELDAIKPDALAKLVRDEVYGIRDADLWAASVEREDAMKKELAQFAAKSKFKE